MNHLLVLASFFILLILPAYGQAHNVRIFAYGEGEMIKGETAFSGGRFPKNAEVRILDNQNKELITTCLTDQNGKFSLAIPAKASKLKLDLLLTINTGDGHLGEWPLNAQEYLTISSDEGPKKNTAQQLTRPKSTSIILGLIIIFALALLIRVVNSKSHKQGRQ